eukprot:COSAG03_NODE_6777_length_1007_cov_1.008811_2_plen_274_part_01
MSYLVLVGTACCRAPTVGAPPHAQVPAAGRTTSGACARACAPLLRLASAAGGFALRFSSGPVRQGPLTGLVMAKIGEEDPRWIVQDLSARPDKHNVGNWYSSERDMLKEGTARLRAMLENVEQPLPTLEGDWHVRVTKLARCEGEIIFFDRTVNGVRKPTTVVDVELRLEWEAFSCTADTKTDRDTDAASEKRTCSAGGVSTCPELSMGALSEGLTVETRVTDGSATSQCPEASLRGAVTATLTKLLDSVGAVSLPPPPTSLSLSSLSSLSLSL